MGDSFTIMGGIMRNHSDTRGVWTAINMLCVLLSSGCVAQQADLKQTERNLQQRIKQTSEESAQVRAQQNQEISVLREQELPQLRGDVERALHQTQELQGKQDDFKQRAGQLEQQTKKLEQLAGRIETDSATRYAWVQKNLDGQELKQKEERDRLRAEVNSRLDDVNRQMETLRKELIDAVQKTSGVLVKNVDTRLEEQRKSALESQSRSELLAAKFTQFSQAMTGFKESLAVLSERLSQQEQGSKATTAHINEMNKAVTGHLGEVNKSVTGIAQKFAARFDEQDRRLDTLSRAVDSAVQDARQRGGGKAGSRQSTAQKPGSRPSAAPTPEAPKAEPELSVASHQTQGGQGLSGEEALPATVSEDPSSQQVSQTSEPADKPEYERLLGLFRDGDLDGARQGFVSFLREYPNSELAPNARYWLGESYYGKQEYKQAIDSYDRVELDFPRSEKVPAALLKKGYAYLAMKDKRRAASAFKQVVTLYPRSPEAGKASAKLSQLKE